MITRMRALGLVSAALVLGGCAASGGGARYAATTAAPAHAPCLKDTGSRLPASEADCMPGRSYSKSDIDATGETNAAGALRLMDPSITVTR